MCCQPTVLMFFCFINFPFYSPPSPCFFFVCSFRLFGSSLYANVLISFVFIPPPPPPFAPIFMEISFVLPPLGEDPFSIMKTVGANIKDAIPLGVVLTVIATGLGGCLIRDVISWIYFSLFFLHVSVCINNVQKSLRHLKLLVVGVWCCF